jgi:NADH-quinone oxidoreductase subunit M
MILSNSLLLQLSLAIPLLIAALCILNYRMPIAVFKVLASLGFILPLLIAVKLFIDYDAATTLGSYAYVSDFDMGLRSLGITLQLGLNGVSLPLYTLATIIGLAAGLYALTAHTDHVRFYLIMLLFMHAGALGTFASVNLFYYYFFHELAFIPTFVAIGMLGGKGKRAAAIEMALYLTAGALLVLVGLIAIYSYTHSLNCTEILATLKDNPIPVTCQKIIFGFFLFGFGILAALCPFHSWAPNTYTAAPASVTMIHAGVLKNFGIYGLIQIALPFLPEGILYWKKCIVLLGLSNVLFIGMVTIAQLNLKRMISYSSVMHIGYNVLGVVCIAVLSDTLPLSGVILLMVGHGLSTALLFLLTDILHKRIHTYDLDSETVGGLYQKMPILALFFGMALFASIGLPGFANFWGELFVFMSLWEYSLWIVGLTLLGIIISAVYALRAFASIFLGPKKVDAHCTTAVNLVDITFAERIPSLVLLGALLLIGVYPSCLLSKLL